MGSGQWTWTLLILGPPLDNNVIPTKHTDRVGNQCARGGTCFSAALQYPQVKNSRILDSQDNSPANGPASLEMTD